MGPKGLSSNFIVDGLLFLFGPFFLWIGGALVLGRIGAAGPRIFTTLFGWTPVLTDIKRGLRGSGSSESVNRLAIILFHISLPLQYYCQIGLQCSSGSQQKGYHYCDKNRGVHEYQFRPRPYQIPVYRGTLA